MSQAMCSRAASKLKPRSFNAGGIKRLACSHTRISGCSEASRIKVYGGLVQSPSSAGSVQTGIVLTKVGGRELFRQRQFLGFQGEIRVEQCLGQRFDQRLTVAQAVQGLGQRGG